MEAGVEFTACDLPEANRFILHIMAAVAEYEREAISARTKAALAAAKARGVKLGAHSQILAARRIEAAESYARSVENSVRDIINQGVRTVREVVAGLNARGVPARLGGTWYPSSTGAFSGVDLESGARITVLIERSAPDPASDDRPKREAKGLVLVLTMETIVGRQ